MLNYPKANSNVSNSINYLYLLGFFEKIICDLQNLQLDFLPFKGIALANSIYKTPEARQTGDLDLLFKKKNAVLGLNFFISEGFQILRNNGILTQGESFEDIINAKGMNEVTLIKKVNGQEIVIDFHWGLFLDYLPYSFDYNSIFTNTRKLKIRAKDYSYLSIENELLTLLIHHGGKDIWLKNKLLTDLEMFLAKNSDIFNWADLLNKLHNIKILRISLFGFFILQKQKNVSIPPEVSQAIGNETEFCQIEKFYNAYKTNNENILTLAGRLKYERLFISLQDEGFSPWKYFYGIYKMYSYPNPIESPRLITFPENWHFMNALSKLVTYLYKRGFGKVIR